MMQQEEKRIMLVPSYQVSEFYGLLFGELWVCSSF